ncbi:hypothetical protein EUGRSUZ_H03760 [Eucalyptus grandis]|nr:hypothetical protein EUGRSUZ_H03760 [Eucalyptus grandis]
MPYDGSEQLSECRILKNDEVICSEFWLSFWCEVHYDPLYKIQDAPITEKETLDILEEAGRSRCCDLQEMGTKFIPSLYLTYIDSAFQIAQLALQCLQMTPNERPSRTIVVAELESVEAAGANRFHGMLEFTYHVILASCDVNQSLLFHTFPFFPGLISGFECSFPLYPVVTRSCLLL